jgi:hypothetical protein
MSIAVKGERPKGIQKYEAQFKRSVEGNLRTRCDVIFLIHKRAVHITFGRKHVVCNSIRAIR